MKRFLQEVVWRLSLVAALLTCTALAAWGQEPENPDEGTTEETAVYKIYTNTWGDVKIEAPTEVEAGGSFDFTLTWGPDAKGGNMWVLQDGESLFLEPMPELFPLQEREQTLTVPNVQGTILIVVEEYKTFVDGELEYYSFGSSTQASSYAYDNAITSTSLEIKSGVTDGEGHYFWNNYFGGLWEKAGMSVAENNVESITLPNAEIMFASMALSTMPKLKEIHAKATDPAMYETIERAFESLGNGSEFDLNLRQITAYVPAGSKAAYESVSPWDQFKEIIEEEASTEVQVFLCAGYSAKTSFVTVTKGSNQDVSIPFELEEGYTTQEPSPVVIWGGDIATYETDRRIGLNANYQIVHEGLTYNVGIESSEEASLEGFGLPSDTEELVVPAYVTSDEGNTYMVNAISSFITEESGLRKLTIEGRVEILNQAFIGCTSLEEIHCLSETPEDYIDPTYGFPEDILESCIVYVPKGCEDVYKNSGWRIFANIVEEGSTVEHTVTYDLTNLTFTQKEDSITSVVRGDSLTFTLVPTNSRYNLPDSIEVNGADVFTYNDTTGLVTIPSVVANLIIKASAIQLADTIKADSTIAGVVDEIPIATEGEEPISVNIDGVTSEKVTVAAESDVTLTLSGENSLGKVTNEGTLVIQATEGATLAEGTIITNEGTLTDETGLVTEVAGPAALEIRPVDNETVEAGETATLTASAVIDEGASVTFQWQQWNEEGEEWTDVGEPVTYPQMQTKAMTQDYTDELKVATDAAGERQYRCLITRTEPVEGTDDKEVSTTLTAYATVTVTEAPDPEPEPEPEPDPEPSYYDVTLPEVEGATIKPLGSTSVIEGGTFRFTIEIEEGYIADNLLVQANGPAITPDANGVYSVTVWGDVEIVVTGIEPDPAVGVEGVDDLSLKVWSSEGRLFIQTPKADRAYIVTFGGRVYKIEELPAGETAIPMPQGAYIIYVGGESFKISM